MALFPYFLSSRLPSGLPLLLLLGSLHLQASPVISGLHANHTLSEKQVGTLLIEELRCASCHDGIASGPSISAPDLTLVGTRLQPEFLQQFMEEPSLHDPGTTMPDILGNHSPADRKVIAAALSSYLRSLSLEHQQPAAPPKDNNLAAGKALFHEAGCVACHTPRDESGPALPGDVGLDHVSAKYNRAGLINFLHEPLRVRPSGRMPDMELTRQEATALGDFLLGDAKAASEQPDPNASQIAAGKRAFTNLRCITCHQTPTPHQPLPVAAPPRADLKLTQGCLSNTPGAAPNYHLSKDQRTAIRSALTDSAAPTPADEIKLRLTQLNCISCHQRDDFGGVTEARDSYFHSTEEALGNEARLPPPLTLTGAKLQPAWMNKVLYDGERIRPYMTTRMPQYGEEALKGLSDLFTSVDHLDPLEFPPLEKNAKPMLRNGAHLLLGDKGLNCIACHNFNGKESPGMKGLDLMTSYQRLQPAWFDKFLRNPGSLRPGIIMPNYWPDGKSVQTDILEGNTEDQLRALWYNFSFGQSARDPSGLRVKNTDLIVTDRTRTYRGRSSIAGYRGIAVGYPGGLNYAFNAQTGALSGLWKGRFVSVGWRGQGAGNFNPADRAIQLPQDVPFLPTAKDPWPLHPKRTKENPVNPDPLYPRQYHYAFQGYSLGSDDVPTFQYRIGEVSISETSTALTTESPPILRRTLTFTTPKATTLYFRPLTGKLTKLSDTSVGNPDIQLTLGTAPAEMIVRKATGENAGDELLIKFTLPAGTSTQTIAYALLR